MLIISPWLCIVVNLFFHSTLNLEFLIMTCLYHKHKNNITSAVTFLDFKTIDEYKLLWVTILFHFLSQEKNTLSFMFPFIQSSSFFQPKKKIGGLFCAPITKLLQLDMLGRSSYHASQKPTIIIHSRSSRCQLGAKHDGLLRSKMHAQHPSILEQSFGAKHAPQRLQTLLDQDGI